MSDSETSETSSYVRDSDESTAESEVEYQEVLEKASLKTQEVTFCVTELTCPNSCLRICRFLNVLPGIVDVKVNQIIQQCRVRFQTTVISETEIINKIETKGFQVTKLFTFDVEGVFVINYPTGTGDDILVYLQRKGVKILAHSRTQRQIQIFSHSPRQLVDNCLVPVTFQFNNYRLLSSVLKHENSLKFQKAVILLGTIPLLILLAMYLFSAVTNLSGDPLGVNVPIYRALTVKNVVYFGTTAPVMIFYAFLLFKNVRHFVSISVLDENVVTMVCVWILYFCSILSVFLECVSYGVYDSKMEFFIEQPALIVLLHFFAKYFEIGTNKRVAKWMIKLMDRYRMLTDVNLVTSHNSSDEVLLRAVRKKKKRVRVKSVEKDMVFRYDYIRVDPGELIPYDGVIVAISGGGKGKTGAVNQTFFESEDSTLNKKRGDYVLGGTRNVSDAAQLFVRITKKHASILSKIIRHGMESQLDDFKHFSTKIFNLFVPFCVILTFVSFILMTNFAYFFFGYAEREESDYIFTLRTTGFLFGLTNSLNIILVASPCSWAQFGVLVRSVASEVAVRAGMLITKTNFLRTLKKIDHVILNKNGILTTGRYKVHKVKIWGGDIEDEEFYRIVASVETHVRNRIAKTLLDYCLERFAEGDVHEEVTHVYHSRGRGVRCECAGREVIIGSLAYLEGLDVKVRKKYRRAVSKSSRSFVFVAIDGESVGYIILRERAREEMLEVVGALKKMQKSVIVVSADSENVTRKWSGKFGAEDFFSELTPRQKAELIGELKEKGKKVLFIGNDCIEDRPAIAAADLSISTGVDLEGPIKPDLFLLKENLRLLLMPFDLEKKMRQLKVVHLLVVAMYHLIAIPCVSGWFTSYMGVFVPNFVASGIKIALNFLVAFVAVTFGNRFKKDLGQYDLR